jgi:hypothetical protein
LSSWDWRTIQVISNAAANFGCSLQASNDDLNWEAVTVTGGPAPIMEFGQLYEYASRAHFVRPIAQPADVSRSGSWDVIIVGARR